MAAEIEFDIDFSGLDELRNLPGEVGKAGKKAADSLEKQIKDALSKIEKQSKKTGKEVDKLDFTKAKDGVNKFGSAASGRVGDVIGRVTALGEGVAALGAAGGPFAIATLGIAGLAAAAATSTAAILLTVSAAEGFNKELEELQKFGNSPLLPLSDEDREAIERVNDAMSGLKMTAKAIIVALGAEFAPILEDVAVGALALALRFKDWIETIDVAAFSVKNFATTIFSELIQAALRPLGGWLLEITGELGSLASALGFEGLGGALKSVEESYNDFTRSLAGGGIEVATWGLGKAVGNVAGATKDYRGEAEALIGSLRRQKSVSQGLESTYSDLADKILQASNSFGEDVADAFLKIENAALKRFSAVDKIREEIKNNFSKGLIDVDEYRELLADLEYLWQEASERLERDLAQPLKTANAEVMELVSGFHLARDPIAAINAELDMQLAKLDEALELGVSQQEIDMARAGLIIEANEAIDEYNESLKTSAELTNNWEKAQQKLNTTASFLENVLAGPIANINELISLTVEYGDLNKEAAKKVWAIQSALAIAVTVANAAAAAIRALAEFGPVAGAVIAATEIAAATAAAIVQIKAAKPQFALGGISETFMANDAGRVNATLETNEAVLNRTATANLGREGVAALNAGVQVERPQQTGIYFNNRIVDYLVSETLRSGAPLSRGAFRDMMTPSFVSTSR